jgi:hypothetical protein
LTVTPAHGYTGQISLGFFTSNDKALANLCVLASTGVGTNGSVAVPTTAPVTGQIIFDTNAADCASGTGAARIGRGFHVLPHTTGSMKASNNVPKRGIPVPAGIAFAGLLVAGFLGRSSRKLRQLACVVAIASLGLVLAACGGGSSSSSSSSGSGGNTSQDPAKGSYTITITAADSLTSSLTAQQSFTLTIN